VIFLSVTTQRHPNSNEAFGDKEKQETTFFEPEILLISNPFAVSSCDRNKEQFPDVVLPALYKDRGTRGLVCQTVSC
jgi:hypothetical protein